MSKKIYKFTKFDITLMIYIEGKSKVVFDKEDKVLIEFTDKMTAFNGKKRFEFPDKGKINKEISVVFFRLLEGEGIATHFLEDMNDRRILAKKVDIIPLEVVCRNIVAGSLLKRLPLEKGTMLSSPIVEFYLKNDAMGDPFLNEDHAEVLGIPRVVCEELREKARKINSILSDFLKKRNIQLADFKLEFGLDDEGNILLADEITPDSCRFWIGGESYDKDVFRFDLGDVEERYRKIHRLICG